MFFLYMLCSKLKLDSQTMNFCLLDASPRPNCELYAIYCGAQDTTYIDSQQKSNIQFRSI